MHRVALVGAGRGNHRCNVEIRGDATPCECMRGIGTRDMQRTRIVGRVDGRCRDIEFVGGADDADGDFAAVGDENAAYGHG